MELNSNNILKKVIIFFLIILLGLFSVKVIYNSNQKPVAVSVFNSDVQSKNKLDKENLINYLLHFDIRNSKEILQKALPILGSNQQQKTFREMLNNPIILINQISNFLVGVKISDSTRILQAGLPGTVITENNLIVTQLDDKSSLKREGKKKKSQKKISSQKRQALDKKQETELNFSQTKQSQKTQQLYNNNLVGVYHTHTSETYEVSVSNFHSRPGTKGDIVEVGTELTKRLESKYGIQTVHLTCINDKVYRKSYLESRKTARQLIKNNPNLQIVFDIHRDALAKQGDKDLFTTVINGQKVAKIMIVVAKANKNYGLSHPDWKKNLKFAHKLANKINSIYPSLLRKIKVVDGRRYNQDLHSHSILLEFGGINNTALEAKRSARLMADVVASLLADEKND
ncbi:stage II sporulation protein P [Sporohalobacter salinus]|uniref:stage II sporulation protein P n=1 Tax=Sporohalobacter salinus TaxID=1494606 RepID=UPI0019616FF0|nr:stage II sporulation protein P [Sporohalobacter salinus]MBM7623138.1 stage II sporulation protein P [Sporohalobacter salinus]